MKLKTYNYILIGFLSIITLLIVYLIVLYNQEKEVVYAYSGDNYTQVKGGALPEKIDFAGEPVPLDYFFVREALDKEIQVNTYWHSSTLLTMKRSKRWFKVIEPILEKNGIPNDFKYLALIESRFENVVSSKKAAGFWQLLKGSAKELGLEVNKDVDERFNVEKATQAACEYLKESYEKYNNWTLAAASYNAGRRRISKSIKNQYTDNYYNLYLNDETSRYIFRILAIKVIYENPEKYGFSIEKSDYYSPIKYKTLKISHTIKDLPKFAKENGVSYKTLKTLNPWLVNSKMRNSRGKDYYIKVPK